MSTNETKDMNEIEEQPLLDLEPLDDVNGGGGIVSEGQGYGITDSTGQSSGTYNVNQG